MSRIINLAHTAIKFAQAATDTTQHRKRLDSAYFDWRKDSGNLGTHIVRNDPDWLLMMQATADQYRLLRNAKSREYRAKAKLLALVDALDIAQ